MILIKILRHSFEIWDELAFEESQINSVSLPTILFGIDEKRFDGIKMH